EKEITKKQKIDEEAEELKSHLHIVSNDDDVYTEATPLASKIPIQYELYSSGISFLQQGELSLLAVETSSGSRKSSLAVGMPCAVYSQQFSPKLDVASAINLMLKPVYRKIKRVGMGYLRYPLTHFTMEQMLNNVRLKVEEESEMSLEFLRLVRRQLNERTEHGALT
nr:hypothetical protein [Tanacetum cinerariifolium]